MYGVVFHRLDLERAMEGLRDYARELAERPEVREVVLIGSLARGNWSARSDADVVVIVDASEELRGPFRSSGYAPRRHPGIPVDVLVFTADEASEWKPRFRREVERGVRLYARD